MWVLMQCVGEAIVANGAKGLAEMVPGGGFLYSVAADALKRFRERRQQDKVAEDLRQMAQASFDEARVAAEQIAREVASKAPPEERQAIETFLAQIPGAVRRSLRRADDPSGKTVPPGLTLSKPEDLLARLPQQMPRFRAGDRVPGAGGWTLREPLGAGGFGEVWKAGHDVVPDLRAVKFCTDPESRQRLLTHEGKLVARVMREGKHPNVVGLVDAHLEGDAPWLAYEFVGGGDLAGIGLSWVKLAPDERVKQVGRALKQLAAAAGHFHRLSPPLVHRDLKPANILFDRQTKKLKITDFGIGGLVAAKQIHAETVANKAHTQRTVAMLAGSFTPLYASPQQQAGGTPDPRDDVHALGVIAFQMLTGRFDQAPGPRYERDLRAAGVPDEFIRLIGDCVDPDASQRPANGAELASRLSDSLAPAVALAVEEIPVPVVPGPVTKRPPPPPPDTRRGGQVPNTVRAAVGDHEERPRARAPRKSNNLVPLLIAGAVIGFVALLGVGILVAIMTGRPSSFKYEHTPADRPNPGPKPAAPKEKTAVPPPPAKDDRPEKLQRGLALLYGKGEKRDATAGFRLIRQAAEAGLPRAMYHAGEVYEEGYGAVPVQMGEAISWFRKAADAGDVFGQAATALVIYHGSYTTRSKSEAEQWAGKAITKLKADAEQGDARAQVYMGILSEEGLGTLKNETLQADWLHKSAEQGDILGLCWYGRYLAFDATPRLRDPKKGLEAIRKASGFASVSGEYLLGACYRDGKGVAKDAAEAVKWFRKAADAGFPVAMHDLGHCYESGEGVAKDPKEAVAWYQKAADLNYVGAMNRLGICYAQGIGVAKDQAEAVKWYRKGRTLNHDWSMFNLAWHLEGGRGVTADDAVARLLYRQAADDGNCYAQYALGRLSGDDARAAAEWYRKSADGFRKLARADNVEAMKSLAKMYFEGKGVTKDAKEGADWYQKAFEAGDVEAAWELAERYRAGRDVTVNLAEAARWFRKAAEKGHAAAMDRLGDALADGDGVAQNEKEAIKWYQQAADKGDANSMNSLGEMVDAGRGVTKDEAEAQKWYRKAAEQKHRRATFNLDRKAAEKGDVAAMIKVGNGYTGPFAVKKDDNQAAIWFRKAADAGSAEGMNLLGVMYAEGRGVSQGDKAAFGWFLKAAEKGDADGMYNLADLYAAGRGVAKDDKQAITWYRKSAEQGNSSAMNTLGDIYREGRGVKRDDEAAVAWYRQAADKDHGVAMNALGFMYDEGRGVAKDLRAAVAWYRKAAEKSVPAGLYNLGSCYHEGHGIGRNLHEAIKWYKRAAAYGHELAKKKLSELGE